MLGEFLSPFIGGPFIGVFGMICLLSIALLFSSNAKAVSLRIVIAALALQVGLAFFALKLDFGRSVISATSNGVNQLIGYSSEGINMVFGQLAGDQFGTVFAINVLPVIIFFSALTSILYHLGVMQVLVLGIGRVLNFIIGTKPVESLNAAANVFVGQTEAPLVIKPFLNGVNQSQLFAIMVSGLASVSGTILAAYALLGVQLEYLLAASLMAAPGGLLMAKIIQPESATTEDDVAQSVAIPKNSTRHENVVMAAAVGAQDGVKLAVNVGAMLIAFVALIALMNGLLGGLGGLFGYEDLSFQKILGWIFSPLMVVLGVPFADIQTAGSMVGEKLILNEFVAYFSFSKVAEVLDPKTQVIVTFALCGFANLSSIAIQLGGIGSIIPDRMPEIARFGFRAVLGGTLANLMSAAIAGIVVSL